VRTLRVAIVGAGLMGRWHAEAARRSHGRVIAVMDHDRQRAGRLASRFRDCRVLTDLDGALAIADIIHVCTPTASHVDIAARALKAGCHAVVEKPVSRVAAETEELLRLARSNRVLLCPVHQFLFQDGVRAALASPAMRTLRHVDFAICSAGAAGRADAVRDEIAREILPHPLSLLARMLPLDRLAQGTWSIRRVAPGELRALADFGGVTASIIISMTGRPPVNRMLLVGTESSVHVDLFHGFAATLAGGATRVQKLALPFRCASAVWRAAFLNLVRRAWHRETAYPGLRSLVARFYAAVRTGEGEPIPAGETLAVARTLEFLDGRVSEQSADSTTW